jgi:hypothetical protein
MEVSRFLKKILREPYYRAEIENCLTVSGGSLPCKISTKYVKWFIGYMKYPFMALYKLGFIMAEN